MFDELLDNDYVPDTYKPSRKELHIMKTKSKALRKYNLSKELYSRFSIGGYRHFGQYRKGKIHCSCPLCRAKVKYNGYKISDIKKLEKLKYIGGDLNV